MNNSKKTGNLFQRFGHSAVQAGGKSARFYKDQSLPVQIGIGVGAVAGTLLIGYGVSYVVVEYGPAVFSAVASGLAALTKHDSMEGGDYDEIGTDVGGDNISPSETETETQQPEGEPEASSDQIKDSEDETEVSPDKPAESRDKSEVSLDSDTPKKKVRVSKEGIPAPEDLRNASDMKENTNMNFTLKSLDPDKKIISDTSSKESDTGRKK